MKEQENETYIQELVCRKLAGSLSAEEEAELAQWLEASPHHRARYDRLCHAQGFTEKYKQYAAIDEKAAWQRFQTRHRLVRRTAFHIRYAKYAAMLLLPLLVGGVLWLTQRANTSPKESLLQENDYTPWQKSEMQGKCEAVLTTSQGTKITLGEKVKSKASTGKPGQELTGTAANEETSPLTTNSQMRAELRMQMLKTRSDSEYWITLEDGTRVHLNYKTTLAYPVRFAKQQRTVWLDGEAYFEVKEEKDRPFRVMTKQGVVKEYGTSFNVNTFSPNCTKVVLVEGSIGVTPAGGRERLMQPNDMAEIYAGTPEAMLWQVDPEPYIAWNKGRFVFDNCTLEELMGVLAGWHHREVRFANEACRRIRFTGDMDRYGPIESILQAIQQATTLRVETIGNTIYLSEPARKE